MSHISTAVTARFGIKSRAVIGATVALALALLAGATVLRIQLRNSLYTALSDQTLTRASGVSSATVEPLESIVWRSMGTACSP